jgi:hypothetical protein
LNGAPRGAAVESVSRESDSQYRKKNWPRYTHID